jgi:hypothetical protein
VRAEHRVRVVVPAAGDLLQHASVEGVGSAHGRSLASTRA